jgi:hypothetical protein
VVELITAGRSGGLGMQATADSNGLSGNGLDSLTGYDTNGVDR